MITSGIRVAAGVYIFMNIATIYTISDRSRIIEGTGCRSKNGIAGGWIS
jgi:hypothetical protein